MMLIFKILVIAGLVMIGLNAVVMTALWFKMASIAWKETHQTSQMPAENDQPRDSQLDQFRL